MVSPKYRHAETEMRECGFAEGTPQSLDGFAEGTPVIFGWVSRSSDSVASFPVPHRADLPLLSLSVET